MTLHLDIPDAVRDVLAQNGRDPAQAAREAILVELYRRGEITHRQLAEFLGLDRVALDGLLRGLRVFEGAPTLADLEADRTTLDRILGPARRTAGEDVDSGG
jgi:hypothetical protein